MTGDKQADESKTSFKAKLVLLSMSLLLACLALEIMARIMMPAPLPWTYPQVKFVEDEQLIFRLLPEHSSFTADKQVSINNIGLRSQYEEYAKPEGVYRILVLGDSVTFGHGVAVDKTYVARLEELFGTGGATVQAINAAVPSYNTSQEVAYLGRDGVKFQPDIVVVGFHWNDINDKVGVTVDDQGRLVSLVNKDKPVSWTTKIWSSEFGYDVRNGIKRVRFVFGSMRALRMLRSQFSEPSGNQKLRDDVLFGSNSERIENGWAEVSESLSELNILAEQHGFSAYVMAFPIPVALDGDYPNSTYIKRLAAICEENELSLLDLEPHFRDQYNGHESLYIAYDADHPNEGGHQVAANALADFLTKHEAD